MFSLQVKVHLLNFKIKVRQNPLFFVKKGRHHIQVNSTNKKHVLGHFFSEFLWLLMLNLGRFQRSKKGFEILKRFLARHQPS